MTRLSAAAGCLAFGLAIVLSGWCQAEPPASQPSGDGGEPAAVLLDTAGYWRVFVTLRPPLWSSPDGKNPALRSPTMPDPRWETAASRIDRGERGGLPPMPPDQPTSSLPPADWAQPDFDDRGWWRDPGPFFGGAGDIEQLFHPPHASRYGSLQTIALALLTARGKFTVSDPGGVGSLRLSAEFRGGIVVYLNGVEVARKHLPAGPISLETPAQEYPIEASLLPRSAWRKPDTPALVSPIYARNSPEVCELRIRRIDSLELPTRLLRRGVNVLALEIHRAPLNPKIVEWTYGRTIANVWSPLGLVQVRLTAELGAQGARAATAAVGAAIQANAGRPAGAQVWTAGVVRSVFDTDYADPNEPCEPIRIVAARNGGFAGQAVVSADQPIADLRAEVSPLKRSGAPAPGRERATDTPEAATVKLKVVYPRHGRPEAFAKSAYPSVRPTAFDALLETPPPLVPVQERRRYVGTDPAGQRITRTVALGAVQPIWVLAEVPAAADPGEYEGELTVRFRLEATRPTPPDAATQPRLAQTRTFQTVRVPIRLTVCPFTLPTPGDYTAWADFVQSPESLALRYQTPLWSDAHWALIAQSLRLLAQVGNKTLYVPLIARTHFGNEQTLVRFVRQPDGSFRHDFSLMDRYLDLAADCGLKPKAVIFYVWDYSTGHLANTVERWGHLGVSMEPPGFRPAVVTAVDPVRGSASLLDGPCYNDPGAEPFWRPVAENIRRRLAQRGLSEAMMVGLCGDSLPQKEVVAVWQKLLPEARWAARAHAWGSRQNLVLHGQPLGYLARVVGAWALDPAVCRVYGWQNPNYIAYFPRLSDSLQLPFYRLGFEWNLQSGRRGMGQLAGDFLPHPRGGSIIGRFGSSWANIKLRDPWLAAGPDSAVSTVQFQMAREGLQECEARIAIERALTGGKLKARGSPAPGLLADECQQLLDERTRHLAWANEYQNVFSAPQSFLVQATNGVLGTDWYGGGDRWQQQSRRLYTLAGRVAEALAADGLDR